MEDARDLKLRLYEAQSQATLVYLPGLHGDWTLIGGFRRSIIGRVRFVEFTYPRTLTWSLEDYAAAIEEKLANEVPGPLWLLGESFGSQLVWPLLARNRLPYQAAVIAGGFVRHPVVWVVKLGAWVGNGLPLRAITRVLFGYARIARFRYRNDPAVLAGVDEFIARRTELDRQAAVHRLRLIASNDPRQSVCEVSVPLYGITGLLDPVVPWMFVRSWLQRSCPALRDYHIVRQADHNVLGTAPRLAARKILEWMEANK